MYFTIEINKNNKRTIIIINCKLSKYNKKAAHLQVSLILFSKEYTQPPWGSLIWDTNRIKLRDRIIIGRKKDSVFLQNDIYFLFIFDSIFLLILILVFHAPFLTTLYQRTTIPISSFIRLPSCLIIVLVIIDKPLSTASSTVIKLNFIDR